MFNELIRLMVLNHVKLGWAVTLRILTGKKHPQIKLQRLQKVGIWAFGSLVHQINSSWKVLKLKQNFQQVF